MIVISFLIISCTQFLDNIPYKSYKKLAIPLFFHMQRCYFLTGQKVVKVGKAYFPFFFNFFLAGP